MGNKLDPGNRYAARRNISAEPSGVRELRVGGLAPGCCKSHGDGHRSRWARVSSRPRRLGRRGLSQIAAKTGRNGRRRDRLEREFKETRWKVQTQPNTRALRTLREWGQEM